MKQSNEAGVTVILSQDERAAIDKGLKSIEDGRFKSNEEVKEATRKKYSHLFR